MSWTVGEEWPCDSPSFSNSLNKLGHSIIFDLPVNLVPLSGNTLYCFNFWTNVDILESFPRSEVYHCIRPRNTRLSSISLETNATSPPGVHISPADPVQASRINDRRRGSIQKTARLPSFWHGGINHLHPRKTEDYTCRNPVFISHAAEIWYFSIWNRLSGRRGPSCRVVRIFILDCRLFLSTLSEANWRDLASISCSLITRHGGRLW